MSVAEPRSVPEHAAPWPMVAAYGEIHRYVGDELIATWKLSNGIADAHCVRARFDAPERPAMSDQGAVDLAHAERLVAQALAVSPASPLAHYAKGEVLRAQGRPEKAIPEYETAIASNRNSVYAISALADCKLLTGSIDEVIPAMQRAIRLSPRDPIIFVFHLLIGVVHLLQSHTDEAIVWFKKARNAAPAHPSIHALLASAHALDGDSERAAAKLAEARRLSADHRYASITRLKVARYF